MATTKTLTPTNQAITLAAFTEKPDNRTNVTNDDKLADAVNALNSHKMSCLKKNTAASGGTLTFTFSSSGARYSAILFITQNNNNNGAYFISGKAQTGFVVTKLGGTFDNITVDQSTGTISVTLGTWSQATLLHDALDNEFA